MFEMASPRHGSPGLGRSPLRRSALSNVGLSNFMHHTQLDALLQGAPVIAFEQDTTIEEVLETLGGNRILSAPVFLRQTDGTPSRSIESLLGFVDVMSVLDAFIAELGYPQGGAIPSADQLEAAGVALCAKPVKALFGDANPLHQATTAASGACGDYGVRPSSLQRTAPSPPPPTTIDEEEPLGEEEAPPPAACALASTCQASLHDIIRDSFLVSPLEGAAAVTAAGRLLPHPSIHRVAVFDPDSRLVTHILSQSDIVRVLAAHTAALGPLASRSLSELGLAASRLVVLRPGEGTSSGGLALPGSPAARRCHPLLGVTADTPALEAFRLLLAHHVSGLAVVAGPAPSTATLVGNLSASDARCLAAGLFPVLLSPLGDFLEQRPLLAAVQQATARALAGPSIPPPPPMDIPGSPNLPPGATARSSTPGGGAPPACRVVTVQATNTLGELLRVFGARAVHRVYVVDPDQRPVGLVTLSDVLQLLLDAVGG